MRLLDRVAIEFARTGVIYAVNRRTGFITPLSTGEYERYERDGLLEGFIVRLGRVQAEAAAAEIRLNSRHLGTC